MTDDLEAFYLYADKQSTSFRLEDDQGKVVYNRGRIL